MFDRFATWAPAILGILRFLSGVMFACHGAQKVFGAFGGMPPGMTMPWYITYLAGPIELFGGILIAIGLAVLFSVVWGTDVAGLFTALGVTSIVLGLALQGAIGSIVSGLLLLFEQPFRLGDWLDAGGVRGRLVIDLT